ncbi:MAG TPA: glycoside hydrolase family 18 protein [Thermoanaerobaculia bacterium]|jgi:chitinase|nr:glycoside hydrolase family 18 protein [Thermoanaerobaculia bacterium]
MSFRSIPLAFVLLLLCACSTTSRYRIIAYAFNDTDIPRMGAEKLTHINYAFGLVSTDGLIVLDEKAPPRLAQLGALKTKNPQLKILLSVGGWGADHFSDAALTDASREKFATSALDVLREHRLDGIDLDWEYPGQPGPGIKYRAEDKQNFTLMLKALREKLGDAYLITIASSAGEYFEHTEMDRLHVYLDWINIMTYDFAGEWTPTTGHHSALHGDGLSAASFVRQHLDAGIPPSKIVMGVPFYGRGWTGVNPLNNGFNQPYAKAIEVSWSGMAAQSGERLWDDEAQAPYVWDAQSTTFISYDDPRSLRVKADFIRKHRLGGVMYWEHSQDPDEELLSVLAESLQR